MKNTSIYNLQILDKIKHHKQLVVPNQEKNKTAAANPPECWLEQRCLCLLMN